VDVKEFYPGDWSSLGGHQEVSHGGVAISKVETTIPFTAMDPVDGPPAGSGVMWLDRKAGTRLSNTDGNWLNDSFGKASGIGDLEVLCDQAPVQIGNRVWYDVDKDGVQDPGEDPVVGATVNLYDGGRKIGTITTNARGEYYFDSTVVKNVQPEDFISGRTYTIRMDNPADYTGAGPLTDWFPTIADLGGNDETDSDGIVLEDDMFPQTVVTLGGPGENDHSLDFGFTQIPIEPIPLIDPAIGITAAVAALGVAGLVRRRRNAQVAPM
jgi:uncharacterized protein (TIGR03382 family)